MAEVKKNEKYVEVDRNMTVEDPFPQAADAVFHSVREEPFDLYNFVNPCEDVLFRRLPRDVAHATSPEVGRLYKETAGGRVRFSTDSAYLLLKTAETSIGRHSHFPLTMSAGFDLYEDTDTDSRFYKTFRPPYDMADGYTSLIVFPDRRMRSFTVNFPLHSFVSDVWFGLSPDAVIGHGKPYIAESPIVVYGSSIVHGTGASRPGMCYTNILSRNLNRDVVNLGFSGNAKAEDAIMDYIASLDMSVFVYDYDHNAPSAEYLRATHQKGFEKVRAAHPDLPIVLITRPNGALNVNDAEVDARRQIVFATYETAYKSGDRHVYYIDGESFFLGKYENDCSIDGVHPNDLGYVLMAEKIGSVLRTALAER